MPWNDRRENRIGQKNDARDDWDVDYARIVHSASFRRLQGKTQILNLGDSDFYRTRLTHSLEVAQIAAGIARQFRSDLKDHDVFDSLPKNNMIQAIGFTHDLGHPPFGHGGEVALNYCMRKDGGFEGNGQTLRILTKLEKFSESVGVNLTRRTLLGVLKYPVSYKSAINSKVVPKLLNNTSTVKLIDREKSKPPKCYLDCEQDVVDWILEDLTDDDCDEFRKIETNQEKHHTAVYKSLDCSIMDLADGISYGVHDLEDATALALISKGRFIELVPEKLCLEFLRHLSTEYADEFASDPYTSLVDKLFGDGRQRKRVVSLLVGYFVMGCEISTYEMFSDPLLKFRADMKPGAATLLSALQEAVREEVIYSANVQHLEFKGQQMIVAVFEALNSEPDKFLAKDTFKLYDAGKEPIRVICDHIAGMTDSFLLKTYDRLFSPRMGSVFDKL